MIRSKTPKLRFPEFTEEWQEKRLDEIFTERKESCVISEEYPQLAFTIAEGVINPEDKKTNKRDFLIKDIETKKFAVTEVDDIIYNPANLKFGAIHRNKLKRGGVSPIYAIFSTEQSPAFMEYLVKRPSFIQESLKYLEGTVIKLMTLKPRDFLLMKTHIPCIPEQKKIAKLFTTLDSYIEIERKKTDSYKTLKASMLQKMFPRQGSSEPEIRFPEFTEAWEQRKFGDLAEYKKGPFGSALKKDIFVPKSDATVKVYEQQNAINKDWRLERYFITQEYANKLSGFRVEGGDIIVSCAGTIGETYEIPMDAEPGIINQALMKIRVKESIVNKKMFIILFTNMIDEFTRVHSNGSAIKNIPPFSDLKPMESFVPEKEEQNEIADYFTNLDHLITLHQRKCEQLQLLKHSLQQKMFV